MIFKFVLLIIAVFCVRELKSVPGLKTNLNYFFDDILFAVNLFKSLTLVFSPAKFLSFLDEIFGEIAELTVFLEFKKLYNLLDKMSKN